MTLENMTPPTTATPATAATTPPFAYRLSKSRFVAGRQCHKLLWWKVHEPNAVELQPDKVLQDRFDQGTQVGALARVLFPGGTLINLPHSAVTERVEATRRAMEAGASSIYEATFVANGVYAAVDILLREPDGRWRLIEVKSSKSQKEEHIVDAAVQLYVVEGSGVQVSAVEIMHLNPDYRLSVNPSEASDLHLLFARTDVTEAARAELPRIPAEIEAQVAMLAGPLPSTEIGIHCSEPYECPFQERCWPADEDHISRLYLVGRKTRCQEYMAQGIHRISQIPPKKKLSDTAKRQIRALKEKRMIVEDGLAQALEPFNCRLGFLDFETIQRAVPVWPGMGPWDQEPAQFSYHEFDYTRGALTPEDESRGHAEFLAEGAEDCRPALAERMLSATRNAERVVAFSGFEKTRIRGLQKSVPDLAKELEELEHKLVDLLPVLRDHVYHPEFHGSFSLKVVLPVMVPDVSYEDLVIIDGMVASVEIARLLFVAGKVPDEERARVRGDLLRYCRRDTWAMVKLLERLRALTSFGAPFTHTLG
jgi:predicted RecB family nuclease